MASRSCLYAYFMLLLVVFQSTRPIKGNIFALPPPQCRRVLATSSDVLQFTLNLLYLEATLYLYGSTGRGIDAVAPGLVQGPAPVGAMMANVDRTSRQLMEEIGLENVGIIRAILDTKLVEPIQMPLVNLSLEALNDFVEQAFNDDFIPPFNTYASAVNFLPVSAVLVTSLIRQYYVGILPHLLNHDLQVVKFGAVRQQLYMFANAIIPPYQLNVTTLVDRLGQLGNRLGMCGDKDEGLIVALQLGAENRTTTNVVPADVNSLAFSRTEREILRICYGTGNATIPGGLFPRGVNGKIGDLIRNLRLS
ncbi:hypothetical protein CCACVL1_22274 [Corchorus capsularis]|uniref:Desiccation-related protein PCC13-62-like protein n=1 Tax=Corchorus capsularis TaxID=210143 RepID=A0A1R3H0J2_COCAP|nr:hypothetical protein CCACVL1_22274 [Corchorus capsularis]